MAYSNRTKVVGASMAALAAGWLLAGTMQSKPLPPPFQPVEAPLKLGSVDVGYTVFDNDEEYLVEGTLMQGTKEIPFYLVVPKSQVGTITLEAD